MSLKKAFENVKKAASVAANAQTDFTHALANSKYALLDGEIPDDIVDVTDYGTADMSWEEFKEKMNEALKDKKESLKE